MSCTWNVNVVYGVPFAFATGTNFNNPLVIFATLISCPAVTFVPLSCTTHAAGNVVIFTPLNVFAGLSFASPKPKFVVVKVYCVSSFVATVVFVPVGSSFTELIVIVTVLFVLYAAPSYPCRVNVTLVLLFVAPW